MDPDTVRAQSITLSESDRASQDPKDGPDIAVVITCYNYERYVARAIGSVIDQGCDACEIVVVDDGSTDSSWDVIRRSNVRAFRIENQGQCAACLFGFDQTTAPFVLFLDADDELKPGSLRTILAALDPRVAKLQFALTCIDGDDRVIQPRYPVLETYRDRERLVDQVLKRSAYQTPPTSGNVFRRDVCELLRACDYDRAVDGVILFAAPFMGDVVSLSDDLGIYRLHDRNHSGLGRAPNPATFTRDMERFVLRSQHLRDIVGRYRPDAALIDPRDTFYYQSLSLWKSISSGRRHKLKDFIKLLRSIASEPASYRSKLINSAFCLVAFLAPLKVAKSLLTLRLSVGQRTPRRLLRMATTGT